MGVMRTDKWLEKEADQPAVLCQRAKPDVKNSHHFYTYLCQFGMYEKNDDIKQLISQLMKNDVWRKVARFYNKYRQKWDGHHVDIYIFPINLNNPLFREKLNRRSGLAFKEKVFLFIGDITDIELEAQFIHEYHHAVRMNKLKKHPKDYTLIDSLVFEGLAEHAVLFYCGETYTLNLDKKYQENELKKYWKQLYEETLEITRNHRLHDYLLFGPKHLPMLGYAIGEKIIHQYLLNNKLSIHESFTIPSKDLLVE